MSYELEVALSRPPDLTALRAGVALPDLRGFPDADGNWPGEGLSLYRRELSTRTTHVTFQDGMLAVVVRALACPEDAELALRVVEISARLGGAAVVRAESLGNVGVADLREALGPEWLHQQAASGARVTAALVDDKRGPIEMPGPVRSTFVGPRLLGELRPGGAAGFAGRLLAAMRRVQWGVPPDFRDAGVFVSGEEDRKQRTRFAVWLPGENLVLPRVDYVALRAEHGKIVMVPFAKVKELAGAHAELLDECQLLISAVAGVEWQAIVERARAVQELPAKR